jgi:hypothetical protein
MLMATPLPADIVYVGYPKAASTFVEYYLAADDQVTVDRDALRPLYGASIGAVESGAPRQASGGSIHISINEKVAESVIFIGDHAHWRNHMFTPGAWETVRPHIRIDPVEAAARIKKAYPSAKVLIVVREQVDWLHSAYRYFLPRLPAGRRTFADFCTTPRGIVYLQAGYFDVTIEAYIKAFGSAAVKVLRFEDIRRAPENFAAELTRFIGLDARPLPREKANEGSTIRAAFIRQRFPGVDSLPPGLRRLGGNLVALLPGRGGTLLSSAESQLLKGLYTISNQRTESLIVRLGS